MKDLNDYKNNWNYSEMQNLYYNQNQIENVLSFGKNNSGGLTFIDIGCNAGSFVDFVLNKNLNLNKIYAFEPNSVLVDEFLNKKYENKDNVKIIQNGIGKENGILKMYIPGRSPALGSFVNREVFSRHDFVPDIINCEVNIITLDSFIEQEKIDFVHFLKIDTEGFEYNVFLGAKESLKNGKILGGQFEWGIEEEGNKLSNIINFLNENGYLVKDYKNSIIDSHTTPDTGNDLFFYKNQ